jgi:hypothetical protein
LAFYIRKQTIRVRLFAHIVRAFSAGPDVSYRRASRLQIKP